MFNKKGNVTVEYANNKKQLISNPIEEDKAIICCLSNMINKIISEEFAMLKNTSLLHDITLYYLIDKMNTIQKMENVLSYIKKSKIKKINEISFKNGDINIKCSI